MMEERSRNETTIFLTIERVVVCSLAFARGSRHRSSQRPLLHALSRGARRCSDDTLCSLLVDDDDDQPAVAPETNDG